MYNGQPAIVMTVVVGMAHRKRLVKAVQTALAAVNSNPSAGVVDRQFTLRELARAIARYAFGDALLRTVRHHLEAGGIVMWNGLPEPPDGESSCPADITFGEAMVAVLAQGTTESFGYKQEDGGRHFQRLVPVPGVINGGKTPDALLPHLDNAFLATYAQPQVIHLYCRCNLAGAATIFFTMESVLQGLRDGYAERVIDDLQRPAYLTAISNSFCTDAAEKAITTRARPVLYCPRKCGGPTHFLAKAYDAIVQSGLADESALRYALDAYQTVLRSRHDLAIPITARPGQAISFHQQCLLHGRGPIENGRHREMVRSYGRFSLFEVLCRLRHVPTNLVLDAKELVDR